MVGVGVGALFADDRAYRRDGQECRHWVPAEWCNTRLRCHDRVVTYDERGECPCPDCGSYSAELSDLTTSSGRF